MSMKTTVLIEVEKRQEIQDIMVKRDKMFKGALAKALREAIDDWIVKNGGKINGG